MEWSRERHAIGALFVWYLLLFWAGISEYRPGMDAMTYGALAKHVISTGDWRVLHYTGQSYPDFYQHPPLAIWMSAGVFGLFGSTDVTQKILPTLFALFSLGLTYLWVRRARGRRTAFFSGVILLSSTRFLKYSSGFMLDPFLSAFLLAAVFLAWNATRARSEGTWQWAISGVSGGLAFLSKGIPALALLPIVGIMFLGRVFRVNSFWRTGLDSVLPFVAGLAAPICGWLVLGDGGNYLSRYWSESVIGRLGGGDALSHLGPILSLFKSYWPWLPVLVFAVLASGRNFFRHRFADWVEMPENLSTIAILVILVGFSASGHFLEQYLVPLFPFAAVLVGIYLSRWFEPLFERSVRVLATLAVMMAVVVSVIPVHLHGNAYREAERVLLQSAALRFQAASSNSDRQIRRIAISTGVGERWRATALAAWYTDWDVWSGPSEASIEESQSQLLLAVDGEPVAKEWRRTELQRDGLVLYEL